MMSENRQDRVIWSPLQVKHYTVGDVAEALVLLHNVRLVDDDELKRLAEKADRMWPTVSNEDVAERIIEIEDEIRILEGLNEADRARLDQYGMETYGTE